MKIKNLLIFLLSLILFAFPILAVEPVVDSQEHPSYTDPESGAEMLPLRLYGERLGWQVDWDEATRSVLLSKGSMTAKVKIGDDIYIANIKIPYILEAKAVIINDRTYVPASFFPTLLFEDLN